jgi:hypothetical protein
MKAFWCRSAKKEVKAGLKPASTHVLREALRNYIDVLYNNPNPESLEKAYKELKELSPGIENEILIGVK